MAKRLPPMSDATHGAALLHAWLYRSYPTHKATYGRNRVARVALDLGVHENAVRGWARGRAVPSRRHMAALEVYCAVPVSTWFQPREEVRT